MTENVVQILAILLGPTGIIALIIAWIRFKKKDTADAAAINATTMISLADNLKSIIQDERELNRQERERCAKLQAEADEQRQLNNEARWKLEQCLSRCARLEKPK